MTLDERRKLLREAAKAENPRDITGFQDALAGATEEERTSLAKTQPPTRLIKAEGMTARACFTLAALGKPRAVAEALSDLSRELIVLPQPDRTDATVNAAVERDETWLYSFLDELGETYFAGDLGWRVSRELVNRRKLQPESETYLRLIPYRLVVEQPDGPDRPRRMAERIVDGMRSDPLLLTQDFWALFRTEGIGSNYHLTDYYADAWDEALKILCADEPGFRERVRDESLRALLRDFSQRNVAWYLRVHRLIEPTAREVLDHQGDYFAVLATTPSTAVGLAQDMLALAVTEPDFDAGGLIDVSAVVLGRGEKKLLKAQLGLLERLVTAQPQVSGRVSDLVGAILAELPIDIQKIARKLVTGPAVSDAPTVPDPAGEPVKVPGPRSKPLPGNLPERAELTTRDEFLALAAEHFEGVGDGADIPRMLAYALANEPELPAALADRARQLVEDDWEWDPGHVSPARHIAAVLLKVPSATQHQGFARYEYPNGYRYIKTNAPSSVFAGLLHDCALAITDSKPLQLPVPIPAETRIWRREVLEPGDGTFTRDLEVLGPGDRCFWLADPLSGDAFTGRLMDVSDIPAEFTFRAGEARGRDGFDQLVQWTAWMLQNNPDTLAAQFHPVLSAATAVVNVRGLGPLLAALGASRNVPGGPTYSAIALAASAKEKQQRAQAAEALAQLAESGLFNPAGFAAELRAHLADGFVMTGRVADTLADAASISAISGYRVLQVLGEILPALVSEDGKPVVQAGKLVELAVRLSGDYGTPLDVPELLARRRKGSSALAVAIRALENVVARPTDLAREAAAQAENSLA